MISLATLFELSESMADKISKLDMDSMELTIRVTEDDFKKINEDCFLRLTDNEKTGGNIPIYDEINMKIGMLNIKYERIADV